MHCRHTWTDPSFDDLLPDEQRRIAPPRPMNSSQQVDSNGSAITQRHEHVPGAELVDRNVQVSDAAPNTSRVLLPSASHIGIMQVRRARPQTAPAQPRKDAEHAASWRARHNFTFYTPSDDPKASTT